MRPRIPRLLFALSLLLTACQGAQVLPGDGAGWDGRYSCHVKIVDDIGLPDYEVRECELKLYDRTDNRLLDARRLHLPRGTTFDFSIREPALRKNVRGELTVRLAVPGHHLQFSTGKCWERAQLSADGVLQLPYELRTSQVDPRYTLIHGRMLFSDGAPIAHQPVALRPPLPVQSRPVIRTATDAQGYFAAMAPWGEPHDPDSGYDPGPQSLWEGRAFDRPWRCALGTREAEREFDWFEIPKPTRAPSRAVLGDCVFPGGELQVTIDQPLHENQETEVRSGSVRRVNGGCPTSFLLLPGVYAVSVKAHDLRHEGQHCTREGLVEVTAGARVEYAVPPFQPSYVEVAVQTPDGEPLEGALSLWWHGNSTRVNAETQTPLRLLRPFSGVMRVNVESEQYLPTELVIPPGVERVTLALQRRPAPAAVFKVEVRFPPDLEGTGRRIVAVHESGERVEFDGKVYLHELPLTGRWKLYLFGAERGDYDGILMAEPVELDAQAGPAQLVVFEVFEASRLPQWPYHFLDFDCGRSQVWLSNIEAEHALGRTRFRYLGAWGGRWEFAPMRVVDGDPVIPLKRTAEGPNVVMADLPVRARIRLAQPLPESVWMSARLRSLDPGSNAECVATIRDGVAELWLPPGPAELIIESGAVHLRQRVELRRDEVAEVVYEPRFALVHFDFVWGDAIPQAVRYPHPDWIVESLDDPGASFEVSNDGFWTRDGQTLPPGRYRARCISTRFAGEREFVLAHRDDVRLVLEVQRERPRGTVLLKLPTPLTPGPQSGSFAHEGEVVDWHITPEGIELSPVPLDSTQPISGCCGIAGRYFWLEPLLLPTGFEGGALEATWRPGRPCGDSWRRFTEPAQVRLSPDAPWIELTGDSVPTGDFELQTGVYYAPRLDSLSIAQEEGSVDMPPDLYRALRAERLLER